MFQAGHGQRTSSPRSPSLLPFLTHISASQILFLIGLTLIIVEAVKQRYGVSGLPYEIPAGLGGQVTVGSVMAGAEVFTDGVSFE